MQHTFARVIVLALAVSACGDDGTATPPSAVQAVPPPAEPAAPTQSTHAQRPLFGDLHIHTSFSPDAFTVGNRTTPDDAYAFARGEQTMHAGGFPIRLHRPLDFAAVTDHSEYMGVMPQLLDPASALSKLPIAEQFRGKDNASASEGLRVIVGSLGSGKPMPELVSDDVVKGAWGRIVEAAERANKPGEFTALIGYEWTSMVDGANLHRNVIFRGASVPERPFSSFDSGDPERLWEWLEAQRAKGNESLAIPHNANASDGLMYGRTAYDGRPFDADYVTRRLRNEPVQEIIQIKGQSETHPVLSVTDEFAGFELFPWTLKQADAPTPSKPQGSYAREALGVGLELAAEGIGNPYRFGFIGSSDSHNSSSAIEEDNYHGKLPLIDGTPRQRLGLDDPSGRYGEVLRVFAAQGLAAVWAAENTRESIFDALRRGETYATSGTRIRLRVFAGWDFPAGLESQADYADRAYASGVPMGSDLPARPAGTVAPRLLIHAARDPDGANLDRVQVVKGWLGADGKHREKIFEVAWAGERVPDAATGRLPAVGNTVDTSTATWRNTIGSEELRTLWTDPEFDAAVPAFYYVRVLEIPTPRWSTYDAEKLAVAAPEPAVIQERAVGSPFWYAP